MCIYNYTNYNYSFIQDKPRLPILNIFAALVCAVGVLIFMSEFYRGVTDCIKMLERLFAVRDPYDLPVYRTQFCALSFTTICFAALTVASDYLRTDARYSRYPMCSFCNGSGPVLCVSSTKETYVK